MKHALRKYISPCGSALFMVVSTMAALIVLVTAMYMSVLSSRQVQYATFDQEQAYVSSTSMADAVFAMFKNPGDVTGMSDFVNKITDTSKFEVGDYVTASESDLGVSSGGIMDSYNVTITRMSDEVINTVTWYVYDIAVTVDNNGIVETTHTFVRTKDEAPPKTPKLNKFFTATGYLPNDVIINSGTYNDPLYFDAEYVKVANMSSGGGQQLNFNCPLTCAGTLTLDGITTAGPVSTTTPSDWVIGNDFTVFTRPYEFYLGGKLEAGETMVDAKNRGRIMVGGNFSFTQPATALLVGKNNQPTDLYVIGNCTIGESDQSGTTFHGNLYVGGDLIIASHKEKYMIDGNIYLNGNIICDEGDKTTANFKDTSSGTPLNITWNDDTWVSESTGKLKKWSEESTVPGMSVSETKKQIKETIGASVYPKWVVDTDKLDEIDIAFCNMDQNPMVDWGYNNDVKEKLASLGYSADMFKPNALVTISEDCIIHHIYDYGVVQMQNHYTVIIDTGKAGETRTINLVGNRDTDGDGVEDTFSWLPLKRNPRLTDEGLVWDESEFGLSNAFVNIVTVGDGNLAINIDERPVMVQEKGKWIENGETTSVVYRSSNQEFIGHYAWFMFLDGKYIDDFNGTGAPVMQAGSFASHEAIERCRQKIHYSSKCDYSCVYKKTDKKDEDGNPLYVCETHPETILDHEPEKEEGKGYICECDGRINKDLFTGSKYVYNGKIDGAAKYASVEQKPNVNIFLISCSESAQIVISNPLVMGDAKNNSLFGYIYAPYMTYIDNSSGGGMKNVGGLIVSDYIMSGYYTYVFALPDQSIYDIEGENIKMDDYVVPAGNREWRVNGV